MKVRVDMISTSKDLYTKEESITLQGQVLSGSAHNMACGDVFIYRNNRWNRFLDWLLTA